MKRAHSTAQDVDHSRRRGALALDGPGSSVGLNALTRRLRVVGVSLT